MIATKGIASADALRHVLSNEPQPRTPDRKTNPLGAPRCRIYQPPASVMQSGRRTKGKWLLESEPASQRWIEPLMAWTASDDPFASARLTFATRSAAIDYAERHGLDYEVIDSAPTAARSASFARAKCGAGRPMRRIQSVAPIVTQPKPDQHAWR